ncbi:MAG TPA: SCO1664 family protein [Chloroflexota bacterium]|nr:SCO1664 family protein [Chloroflexota bacterium]
MARRRQKVERISLPGRQSAGSSWSANRPDLLRLLAEAEIVECRPIMWGSNGTFLITLCADGDAGQSHAVYKPRRGESPLWDFPRGTLYRREMATYLVSAALGWSLVPPTVVRDGPYGVGSVQLFIEHDPNEYFSSPAQRDRAAAEQIALLDVLLNNADRKSEHCLYGLDGQTWAIDHGLTFHTDPKLRTVIWDFAGEPIPDPLLANLEALCGALDGRGVLAQTLRPLVAPAEIEAVLRRLRMLLRVCVHPDPGAHRRPGPWGW